MLSKALQFVKARESDIILGLGVFLACLLSFAAGYLMAIEDLKEPLEFENGSIMQVETQR
ncbi:MAG: hypothetical protein HYV77_02995 [Candidatus Wildermuthbacteria bacterium]|nr:hypothetical protein [Candidatus Wildermuthbacteria bacterium]